MSEAGREGRREGGIEYIYIYTWSPSIRGNYIINIINIKQQATIRLNYKCFIVVMLS